MQGDSDLVTKHINREFTLKEIALLSYRNAIQKLTRSFSFVQFDHVLRAHNKHINALATLASKTEVPDKTVDMIIIKKIL